MNIFIILMLISILFSVGTGGILLHKRHVIEWVILGICWFFCSYVMSTMCLFLLDVFTLERGMQATCFVDAVIFFTSALTGEKISLTEYKLSFNPEKEMQAVLIPLLVALVGISFTAQKNELFGMGQDEGVYQCEAINFLNGYDKRQQDFEEYHLLEEEESQENFQTAVHNKLAGYDIPVENYPDTVYNRNVSSVSGIYHGIPTYPAMLALWGKVAGMERMADIQTIFYVLSIFLIGFICDNLNLKQFSKLIACGMTAISPAVIWVAKSSLTEMFLALLMGMYLYFLTEKNNPECYGFSIIPIMAFSCYHVSVYTLMPYFVMTYAGMYFFTKRKIFSGLLLFSVLGYVMSYLMMRHVQPFYTMNNYRFVFNQHINVKNITQVVIFVSGILLLCCMAYVLLVSKLKKTTTLEEFLSERENKILLQWLLIGLESLPLIVILYKAFKEIKILQSGMAMTLSGFVVNAGILLMIFGILTAFLKPGIFLESESALVIFVAFFYCVLVYSTWLRFEIEYYYYYARYLVPFIPIAIIFSVMVLNKRNGKLLLLSSIISVIVVLPYSEFLVRHQDDTRMEWEILEDITEKIPEKSCVIIDSELQSTLWLPVRAITGAAVYPEEKNLSAQMKNLSSRYDEIEYLGTEEKTYLLDENLEILYQNTIHCSEDENDGTTGKITMPLNFSETEKNIYCYRYLAYQTTYQAEDINKMRLYGIEEADKRYCWTVKESAALRCILPEKNFRLIVRLGSILPLQEMKKNRFSIRLSVNGVMIGVQTLTTEHNQRKLIFDIPKENLTDGSNIISFETELWNASAVNPKDDRTIGIPLQSLVFQERKQKQ